MGDAFKRPNAVGTGFPWNPALCVKAGIRARPPPRAVKPRPRAQRGHTHTLTTTSNARRAQRSATMLAVRHWLGFGSRNTAEGVGTATSGGALAALADAASGGAC